MNEPPSGGLAALARIASLVEVRRWADASGAARALLAVEPENWRALCLLSQSLSAQGDYRASLEAARAAVTQNPASDWPHRLASIAERSLGNLDAARRHAELAVQLAPQLSDGHRVLTQALLSAGRLDAAVRPARQALALGPGEAANHRTIGAVAFARGELEAADHAFRSALAIDPDDAVSHNELARIALRRSQQSPRALAASAEGFARALAADPRQSGSRNNLELVLRIFLARGAWFLFIVAWLGAVLASDTDRLVIRVIVVGLLLVPVGFSVRFIASLKRPLRAALLRAIWEDLVLLGAVLVELLSAVAIVVGSLGRAPVVLVVAVVLAILARLLVFSRLRRSVNRGRRNR